MKKNLLVTVIVPIYNAEKYLGECIDSIVNQTYKNIEIILVNDGSKDKSIDICQEYANKDARIKIIDKQNSGVSDTRNEGIAKSNGDYLMFVDSDDTIDKMCVEKMVNESREKTFIIGNILRYKGKYEKIQNYNNTTKEYSKIDFLLLYKKMLINAPVARLYDANIIKNNNICFNRKISLGEDLLFNFEYLNNIEKITLISDYMYYYRLGNNNSLSSKYYSNMYEIQKKLCNEFRKFFQYHPNKKEIDKESINFYTTIVSNEFHNSKNSFVKNYFNARKIMKDKDYMSKIFEYRHGLSRIDYFFLKNKMYLIYLVIKKIKGENK